MVKLDERILVLSVDRDNDLGQKAGIKGPLVGRKTVVSAATEFALVDPSDSDMNAIFQAVRIFDEVTKANESEVAVLTGHQNVGIQSDKEIARQLDIVLKKFKATSVVFVSDGSEDENVLPIVQSRVPILSVHRLVVKQAEQLESAYFKVKDFLSDALENPKIAGLVFGLPAIIFLLFGIFGTEGIRIVLILVGAYLFVKGFKLEDYVVRLLDEFRVTLQNRRVAFFFYMVAIAFIGLGTFRGIVGIQDWLNIGLFETIAAYISTSVYLYYFAVLFAWLGRNISVRTRSNRRVAGLAIFGFAVAFVVASAAELILTPEATVASLLPTIALGFVLLVIGFVIEYKG
ncbi:MAG: DUF373 family protein [Nanoarchaeota archaeon]|nr:DUF373 family protein [Nanoarchaeota archaeon]